MATTDGRTGGASPTLRLADVPHSVQPTTRASTSPDPVREAQRSPGEDVATHFPARVRIMGWVMLLMAVVLVAVAVMTYSLLNQRVDQSVDAALNQEIQEFVGVARGGVDRATGQPFANVEQLLFNHVQRQFPDDDEVILAVVTTPAGQQVLRQPRRGPFPLSEHPELVNQILDAPGAQGTIQTEAGELRWAKALASSPNSPTEQGTYIVGYFADRDRAEVTDTLRTLILVSLFGLALTGGAAWLVSGQILAPVRLVRRAAAEITEQDLSRRIPVSGKDDIAALAEQFNAMLDRLEVAFATQRQFLDDASHELRTPITIIRGHLELVGDDPAEWDDVVRIVTDELDRMSRIVEDLLLLAKSERPDFVQPERTSVAELTSDIEAKVRALADRRWVLEAIGEGDAVVDPQRVTQAMVQLAQNAVQHTESGAEIRIGSALHGVDDSRGDDRNRHVSFWVTDTGRAVLPGLHRRCPWAPHRRRPRAGHRQGHRRRPSRFGAADLRARAGCDVRHRAAGRWGSGTRGRMRVNRILIAEDEERIASFVEKGLTSNGFTTTLVADGESALQYALTGGFDLVILDIGLPIRDGFTVLRTLREAQVSTPVIILTARDTVRDTVAGLEGGADDYMTKPFRFEELLARVRLRLRASSRAPETTVLRAGELSLDLRTRRARVGQRTVDLTAREFVLLELFLRHPGQVLSREQILSHVWGYDFDPGSNVVDVYVRALRKKLGAERIATVRGMGYRLA